MRFLQSIVVVLMFLVGQIQRQSDYAKTICDLTVAVPIYQQVARAMTIQLPQVLIYVAYPFLIYKIWIRRNRTGHTGPRRDLLVAEAPVAAGVNPPVLVPGARRGLELKIVLWSVAMQIIVWTPFNVASVMLSTRFNWAYMTDLSVLVNMFMTVLSVVDPMVFVTLCVPLRAEMLCTLRILLHSNGSNAGSVRNVASPPMATACVTLKAPRNDREVLQRMEDGALPAVLLKNISPRDPRGGMNVRGNRDV